MAPSISLHDGKKVRDRGSAGLDLERKTKWDGNNAIWESR